MSFRRLIPESIKKSVRFLLDKVPLKVEVRPLRTNFPLDPRRHTYQQRFVNFDIRPTDRVLDAGSGGDPFPYATVLVDRYLESTFHRYGSIQLNGKPLICADIQQLPFPNKIFDFVYCAHLLEHVSDPLNACAELMRIGKRGYVETPAMSEDILFAWAKDRHKWHVVSVGKALCFFEYSARQLEGIGSTAWEDVIMDKRYHPLQPAYFENRDLFNVMFEWVNSFSVYVFHLDGQVETLNN